MKGASSIKPFGLRMPPDVKAWLTKQAKNNGRSANSEIVVILRLERERRRQQGASAV